MKPTTSRDILFEAGDSIKIRLGDILILRSPLKALDKGDLVALTPLAILVVGFFMDDVYFVLLGLDALEYSISKHTKKGLVLLSKKGKEIKVSEDGIVQFFKTFRRRKSSDTINGLMLYLRTSVTNLSDLKNASVYKISKRLSDMVEWPDMALIMWANKHLHVPSRYVPKIDYLDDRRSMINHMIQLCTTRARTFPKKNEVRIGNLPNTAEEAAEDESITLTIGSVWDRDVGAYRPKLSDRIVYYSGGHPYEYKIAQYNTCTGQMGVGTVAIDGVGERSSMENLEVAAEVDAEEREIAAAIYAEERKIEAAKRRYMRSSKEICLNTRRTRAFKADMNNLCHTDPLPEVAAEKRMGDLPLDLPLDTTEILEQPRNRAKAERLRHAWKVDDQEEQDLIEEALRDEEGDEADRQIADEIMYPSEAAEDESIVYNDDDPDEIIR